MATQIAATPIVTGKYAKEILKSIKKQPSAASKKNGQDLINFFKNFESKGK
ncbi:hypothetical protein PaecuDRAFT_2626 [Paenibacillus curdlanolyticus YK9]|uniref:Uncharacterized protein n=1 Tax=Paenibacillus curdlanolyticus YK9 TaxID=717606 RepID=E0IAD7_9BACL|nr:hypothetical protein [Paenibacillus curdlanolyticus]EFM10714.1 hypothetical protein PaecuDRAFT_2626 [Paenibacillus curdlanolyticus YK9]